MNAPFGAQFVTICNNHTGCVRLYQSDTGSPNNRWMRTTTDKASEKPQSKECSESDAFPSKRRRRSREVKWRQRMASSANTVAEK